MQVKDTRGQKSPRPPSTPRQASPKASSTFLEVLTEGQIQNLANYFVTLPSEVAMKLWTVIGDTDNIDNVVAIHKAVASNGTRVSDHLVTILGGDQS